MFTITQATAAQSRQIASIWNPVIRDSYATFNSIEKTEFEIAELITNRPVFLLAMQGETVAGFVTYTQFRGGVGYAHAIEHTVMVADGFQRQNVGGILMDAVENAARAAQHHVIMAGICADNPGGISFHTARGFEKVGYLSQVGRKFNQWLDLVLMQKLL